MNERCGNPASSDLDLRDPAVREEQKHDTKTNERTWERQQDSSRNERKNKTATEAKQPEDEDE